MLVLFFATNTSIPCQKCMSINGCRQKGGTILIGKGGTLKEQAVLKTKGGIILIGKDEALKEHTVLKTK